MFEVPSMAGGHAVAFVGREHAAPRLLRTWRRVGAVGVTARQRGRRAGLHARFAETRFRSRSGSSMWFVAPEMPTYDGTTHGGRCAVAQNFRLRQRAGRAEHPRNLLIVWRGTARGRSACVMSVRPIGGVDQHARFDQVRQRLLLAERQDGRRTSSAPSFGPAGVVAVDVFTYRARAP